jgi:hypothetical protein
MDDDRTTLLAQTNFVALRVKQSSPDIRWSFVEEISEPHRREKPFHLVNEPFVICLPVNFLPASNGPHSLTLIAQIPRRADFVTDTTAIRKKE